jgi:hypothetical protein
MTDNSLMKLGKRPRRHDPRTLKLARYLTGALPAAPPRIDWTHGITDFGMMLNDKLGCCTIAAVGHAVQTWTANALGRELTVPDSTILECYEKWDGYNPADPMTDQGGVELDVLNDWRQQTFDGQSLDAYVSIGLHDWGESANRVIGRSGDRVNSGQNSSPGHTIPDIATAIWLFGGLYIGIELPIRAQTQDVWDVPANPGPDDEPGSWGGHAVYVVGYEFPVTTPSLSAPPLPNQEGNSAGPSPVPRVPNPGLLTCITWGQTKKMTWAWLEKYCSEAYALVSRDWLSASGISPSGLDLAALEKDLEVVTSPSSLVLCHSASIG